MKYLLATKNKHKIEEIKSILKDLDVELITLFDLEDNDDVEETKDTFSGNALIKAKYFYDKYNIPTISDDSGLCIEYLNNEPGVYSSRYSGGSNLDNINKVLNKLKDVDNRKAKFVCVICLYDGKEHFFEGQLIGTITNEMTGNKGFGYDPIFYIEKFHKTIAELDFDIKNSISHRYKALINLYNYIKKSNLFPHK